MTKTKGFTLIEVMLCVVVLSIGLVAVNQTMLKSLDVIRYVLTRAEADRVANLKIWEIHSDAKHRQEAPPANERGTLLGTDKVFRYQLQAAEEGGNKLYRVRIRLDWTETSKSRGLTRDFYVRLPEFPKK